GDETITIEKITQEESSPIIRLVDTIIFTALERRASDIHIETRDTEVGVKYRIDGSLGEALAPIAKEHHSTIISRIKVMSELDISERRVPQDGRFKTRYKGRSIDFRVSIMPSIHGEDAVIRILDKESLSEKFRTLSRDVVGFCDSDVETAQIAIPSALTGHLVFTTVHANNVVDVLGRFLNMGVDPYNFVSALNCILAQRLVRVICGNCRKPVRYGEQLLIESGLKPE